MNIRPLRTSGFTLIEIVIVVAIIALFTEIAVPSFVHARTPSQRTACINNLRQVHSAVQQWALERNAAPDASVTFEDISSYLRMEVICPAGGRTFSDSYTINGVTNRPTCQKLPATHILPNDIAN